MATVATEAQKLYHIDDVARFYGVSTCTIRNWIRAGRLQPSIRMTKKFTRFTQDDMNGLHKVNAVTPAGQG